MNDGHRAIIAAIETHNPMLAEAETIKHLSYVTEKMDKLREKQFPTPSSATNNSR